MITPANDGSDPSARPGTAGSGTTSSQPAHKGFPTSRTMRLPQYSTSTQLPPISCAPRWIRTFIPPEDGGGDSVATEWVSDRVEGIVSPLTVHQLVAPTAP